MIWLAWYGLAAFGEIAGCFAFWAWLRLHKSPWWTLPAWPLWLCLHSPSRRSQQCGEGVCGVRRHLHSFFSRMALDRRGRSAGPLDVIGATVCLAGAGIILFGPRAS